MWRLIFVGVSCACWLAARGSVLSVPATVFASDAPLAQQPNGTASEEAAETQQRRAFKRFLTILEARPRYGTALDRVYGYHVERGTLEEFVQSYRDRIAKTPDDGTAWMLLGLLESHRGHDAAAVKAFHSAERQLPHEPLASYYLGRSLLLVGQPDQAVAAFERAIARKPQRSDLLEIFEALGRLHQRAQRQAEALNVWNRLESLFPGDLRVQEQIATILADEGDNEAALRRFEKLSKSAHDRYRQVQFAIRAGELKQRLGRADEAIADFEKLFEQLKPDSWLYRDVRQRIESVFLRTDDFAGLTDYYQAWIEKHGDDVNAMARLGWALSMQERLDEAKQTYAKAIRLAPSNGRLRHALIDLLVREHQFSESIAQYEQLDKAEPNNPDNLQQWGQVILADTSQPEPARKERAAQVWNRLIEAKPDDPVTVAQVADLFRQAKMTERAISLYRKAVELAPDAAQYHEYLGEYFHELHRPDEAKAAWRQIASGKNRNTRNLVRLAEVFSGFGYDAEALDAMKDACSLDPEFADRVHYAELLRDAKRPDASLKQLQLAGELAETPEERHLLIDETVKTYQTAGTLQQQIDTLRASLEREERPAAEDWRRLALYLEAARQRDQAVAAIQKALHFDEESIAAWTAAARIFETGGRLSDAADAARRLAQLDRRYRTVHLTRAASLEMRLGRAEAALKAGRDLLAAAPGNPEHYQFFADLCFQLGRTDEGLDALRRSVRVNPTDQTALLALARALAGQFRTDEAIELYWRAFDKADDLDGQLSVVSPLAELYSRINRFDRLVARLENLGKELNRQREMTMCLAGAYRAAGDLGSARFTLESLLTEDSRDTVLLKQLAQLAEQEGDAEVAARYQRRVNEIAPSKEGTARLAELLFRSGEIDEAETVWMRLVETEREPRRIYQAIDNLIGNGKYQSALKLTGRLLRANPNDWEALYREAVAFWKSDRKDEAVQRFDSLRALDLPDDQKSAQAAYLEQQRAKLHNDSPAQRRLVSRYPPILARASTTYQVRSVLGLDPDAYYYSSPYGYRGWSPSDFGEARIAALAAIYAHWKDEAKRKQFLNDLQKKAADPVVNHRAAWDYFYLQTFRQYAERDYQGAYQAARQLSRSPDPAACYVYLDALPRRNYSPTMRSTTEAADKAPPLSDDEIEHMLACYNVVKKQRPEWNLQFGGHVATVVRELERAHRKDLADKFYQEAIQTTGSARALMIGLTLAIQRGEVDTALKLIDDYWANQPTATRSSQAVSSRTIADVLTSLIAKRAEEKARGDVTKVLDHHLSLLARHVADLPTYGRQPSQTYVNRTTYVRIYVKGVTNNYVRLAFPRPSIYFDTSSIGLLRNAYVVYDQANAMKELVTFLRQRAAKAAGEDRVLSRLALAYVLWWEGQQEPAAAEMQRAVDAAPDDFELRLELAELLQQLGRTDDALALIDAVEPLNRTVMQRREIMALQLAVLAGDIDRARKAAQRLFGLRLSNDVQVQLASQMHQLGMHEMAEAVLARVRRRAGNQATTLGLLMQQYQSQGQSKLAVEIARQILRRTTSKSTMPGVYSQSDLVREQALRILARSGQLKELIERLSAQLKRSPKSIRLRRALAEYYTADGQRDQAKEVLSQMAKLKPDDAQSLYQLAQQLYASGNRDEAIDKYLAAFRKQPALLAREYYQMPQIFRGAKRLDDLVDLLTSIDLRKLGRYYAATEVIRNLMEQKETIPQGMKILRKAWEAFPSERQNLLNSLYSDEIWARPEIYDYACQVLIPRPDQRLPSPWIGLEHVSSVRSGGLAMGLLSHVLQAADKGGRLDTLRGDVDEALKQTPNWLGGQAILAVLDAKLGRIQPARRRLARLLDEVKDSIPVDARWQIAQELESIDALNDLTLRIYEGARGGFAAQGRSFTFSPARRLAAVYVKVGRKQDARDLILQILRQQDFSRYSSSNPGYQQYQELRNWNEIANELLKLGFPVDALRVYNEALSDSSRFDAAQRYGGASLKSRLEKGLTQAEKAVDADALAAGLPLWIRPASKTAPADVRGQPAVDLVLQVQPRSLDQANVTSLFQKAVTTVAAKDRKAQVLADTHARLEALRSQTPDDLSVLIADSFLAFATADSQRRREALTPLKTFIDQHPLEPVRDGTLPNLKARQEAAQQMAIWLVAREAWKDEATRSLGDQLAQRALDAARQQSDTIWLLAMLREYGQAAFDRGDRKMAGQRWSQMLDLILKPPRPRPRPMRPKAGGEEEYEEGGSAA